MIYPTFDNERQLRGRGYAAIAGVDEVGRGCLAGPVVAGAVILPADSRSFVESEGLGSVVLPQWLGDSKKVSAKRRVEVSRAIKELAVTWSVGCVSAEEIDQIGIGPATFLAMRLAVEGLAFEPDFLLVDGLPHPDFSGDMQQAMSRADATVASVSAASIVAKVYRDELMVEWDQIHPEYGLASNKGYGTASHLRAIKDHGPSTLHRRTFLKSIA